jgi:hypothetical protein
MVSERQATRGRQGSLRRRRGRVPDALASNSIHRLAEAFADPARPTWVSSDTSMTGDDERGCCLLVNEVAHVS